MNCYPEILMVQIWGTNWSVNLIRICIAPIWPGRLILSYLLLVGFLCWMPWTVVIKQRTVAIKQRMVTTTWLLQCSIVHSYPLKVLRYPHYFLNLFFEFNQFHGEIAPPIHSWQIMCLFLPIFIASWMAGTYVEVQKGFFLSHKEKKIVWAHWKSH